MRAVYDGRQTLASARDTIQKSFGKAYNVDELGHAVIGDVSELYIHLTSLQICFLEYSLTVQTS